MSSVELRLVLDDDQLTAVAEAVADLLGARSPAETETWPEFMSIERAARYLDFPVERLRKLKERKQIPYYQEGPGCRVFFRRSELDEWMTAFRCGTLR